MENNSKIIGKVSATEKTRQRLTIFTFGWTPIMMI